MLISYKLKLKYLELVFTDDFVIFFFVATIDYLIFFFAKSA